MEAPDLGSVAMYLQGMSDLICILDEVTCV